MRRPGRRRLRSTGKARRPLSSIFLRNNRRKNLRRSGLTKFGGFMTASCSRNAVLWLLAFTLLGCVPSAHGIPAFGRKYGLRCSSCHEAWPMLNAFGQKFKDNGYQLMNDRDTPIWQNPSYWPVTFRITPIWHRESTDKVSIDTATGSNTAQRQITSNGFDYTGLDFHTGGTLDKNLSFYVLPSSDETGAF